jgi:hypothetical protein
LPGFAAARLLNVSAMQDSKEAYCRTRAAECEEKARAADSPDAKAAFLEMQRRWLLSAERARSEAMAVPSH